MVQSTFVVRSLTNCRVEWACIIIALVSTHISQEYNHYHFHKTLRHICARQPAWCASRHRRMYGDLWNHTISIFMYSITVFSPFSVGTNLTERPRQLGVQVGQRMSGITHSACLHNPSLQTQFKSSPLSLLVGTNVTEWLCFETFDLEVNLSILQELSSCNQ